jgi:hypothetical protein
MNKTGTYKWSKVLGKMVLVSDRIPNTQVFDVYCPEGGYYSPNLECRVESRSHKRKILKAEGLIEQGSLNRREV